MESEVIEIGAIFGVSFVLALSGALMPGPLLTVTISESVKKGPWVGPMVILGHGLLELGLVILIILGLGPYLKGPLVTSCVALVGGLVLVFMGYSMFKESGSISLPGEKEETCCNTPIRTYGPFLLGIVMSISNPYWLIWWVTIGLGYLTSAMQMGLSGIASFFLGHVTADLVWYSAVSTAICKGRRVMSTTIYQAILKGCAACLLVFGVWFIYSAYETFMA